MRVRADRESRPSRQLEAKLRIARLLLRGGSRASALQRLTTLEPCFESGARSWSAIGKTIKGDAMKPETSSRVRVGNQAERQNVPASNIHECFTSTPLAASYTWPVSLGKVDPRSCIAHITRTLES